jgi:hypothetical protein
MFSNKIIRQCYRATGDPEPLYDGFTGYRIVDEMLNDGSTRIINVMRKSELRPMESGFTGVGKRLIAIGYRQCN